MCNVCITDYIFFAKKCYPPFLWLLKLIASITPKSSHSKAWGLKVHVRSVLLLNKVFRDDQCECSECFSFHTLSCRLGFFSKVSWQKTMGILFGVLSPNKLDWVSLHASCWFFIWISLSFPHPPSPKAIKCNNILKHFSD